MRQQAKAPAPESTQTLERILIIDDDEIVGEAMRDILAAHGHLVVTAPSPIGATQAILRHNIRVVVLDIHMPSISGDKLAQLLRRNPRLRHVGIILVSSIDLRELEALAIEVSADAVVSKQLMRKDLCAAVATAARRAELRDPR